MKKILLKKGKVEDSLIYELYISNDETIVTLRYRLSRYSVSENFDNNMFGLIEMEEFKKKINSIEKFKTYLGV